MHRCKITDVKILVLFFWGGGGEGVVDRCSNKINACISLYLCLQKLYSLSIAKLQCRYDLGKKRAQQRCTVNKAKKKKLLCCPHPTKI